MPKIKLLSIIALPVVILVGVTTWVVGRDRTTEVGLYNGTQVAGVTNGYQTIAPSGFCPETADYQRVKQIWASTVYQQEKNRAGYPQGSDWGVSGGYDTPAFLASVLESAIACGDVQLISEVADVYNNAYGALSPDTLNTGVTRMRWQNQAQGEQFLSSQQWFYGLTRTLAAISATPSAQRTAQMNSFISNYKSVISGYYKCWIWLGCRELATSYTLPPLSQFVNEMYDNVGNKTTNKYALDDRYQWPMAAVPQLYLAWKLDPSTVDLTGNNYAITEAQITKYIRDSARLLKQRSQPVATTDLQGNSVIGYNIDPGFWRNLYDNYYSSYSGPCFPTFPVGDRSKVEALASVLSQGQTTSCPSQAPASVDPDTSTDLPHAWRLIHLYTALYATRELAGSDFPTFTDMNKVGNQLAYSTSNRDKNYPRFKNYWSGSNGWYRPNYYGNIGYGIAPWQGGSQFLPSGFGLLSGFNPDLRDMTRRIRDIMNSSAPQDVNFTTQNYAATWVSAGYVMNGVRDYSNPNSRYWAYFLASVPTANFVAIDNGATTPPSTIYVESKPNLIKVDDATTGSGDAEVQYSGAWNVNTNDSSRYLGTDHCTGSTAVFSFSGTRATLYGTKAPHFGIVGVKLDNGAEQLIDLYLNPRADQTKIYDSGDIASGSHSLTVRVTGTKNALSTNSYVCVDYFEYSPIVANQYDPVAPTLVPSIPSNPTYVTNSDSSGGTEQSAAPSIITPVSGPITSKTVAKKVKGKIVIPVPVSAKLADTLQPPDALEAASKSAVLSVEYIVNGNQIPSSKVSPYELDTTLLPNGEHIVEQRIKYTDGSTHTQSVKVIVENEQNLLTPVVRNVRLNKQAVVSVSGLTAAMSAGAGLFLSRRFLLGLIGR